jgi:hypothetical protein
MPILISHRGLFSGPDPKLENTYQQICTALDLGYDVETDIRFIDNQWWIGHDEPQWKTDENFLRIRNLWLHAKNLGALQRLIDLGANCFWHQSDDYTVTNHGFIWAYPGKEYSSSKLVMVMPEWADPTLSHCKNIACYGICSDYVGILNLQG